MIFKKVDVPFDYIDLPSEKTKEGHRVYVTPGGQKLPSVTTVLGNSGDHSAIEEWRKRVGEEEADKISRQARYKGNRIHEALELWIDGVEPKDISALSNPLIAKNFAKIAKVLNERMTEVFELEKSLYSNHLMMAGRADLIGRFDGKRSIIDFKGSLKEKKKEWIEDYFLQMTAYSIMWEERTKMPISQLVCIIAPDDSPYAQVFIEHRDNWVKQLLERREEAKVNLGC